MRATFVEKYRCAEPCETGRCIMEIRNKKRRKIRHLSGFRRGLYSVYCNSTSARSSASGAPFTITPGRTQRPTAAFPAAPADVPTGR